MPSASRKVSRMVTKSLPIVQLLRKRAQLMTVRPITPPTEMLMPPPIMTTVRAQEMMMSAALSFSRSKICWAFRKPPPSVTIAPRYMAAKIPILMTIRSCASVRGSLWTFLLLPDIQLTPFWIVLARRFVRILFTSAVTL